MHWADVNGKKEFNSDGVGKVTYVKGEQVSADTYYFRPGQSLGYHRHPEGDQIFFVHEGEGTFSLDDGAVETVALRPGVIVLAPKGVWHNVTAKTDLVVSQATRQPAGMEKR